MKAVLGCLCDPYVHVFLLGLVLVYGATGYDGEESSELAMQPIACRLCEVSCVTPRTAPPVVAEAKVVLPPE